MTFTARFSGSITQTRLTRAVTSTRRAASVDLPARRSLPDRLTNVPSALKTRWASRSADRYTCHALAKAVDLSSAEKIARSSSDHTSAGAIANSVQVLP